MIRPVITLLKNKKKASLLFCNEAQLILFFNSPELSSELLNETGGDILPEYNCI